MAKTKKDKTIEQVAKRAATALAPVGFDFVIFGPLLLELAKWAFEKCLKPKSLKVYRKQMQKHMQQVFDGETPDNFKRSYENLANAAGVDSFTYNADVVYAALVNQGAGVLDEEALAVLG